MQYFGTIFLNYAHRAGLKVPNKSIENSWSFILDGNYDVFGKSKERHCNADPAVTKFCTFEISKFKRKPNNKLNADSQQH